MKTLRNLLLLGVFLTAAATLIYAGSRNGSGRSVDACCQATIPTGLQACCAVEACCDPGCCETGQCCDADGGCKSESCNDCGKTAPAAKPVAKSCCAG